MGNAISIPEYREADEVEGNLRNGTGWGRCELGGFGGGRLRRGLPLTRVPSLRRIHFSSLDRKGRVLYEGNILDGKRHGKGRLMWACGAVYEGEWEEDKLSGYGTLTWASGMMYRGAASRARSVASARHC